MLPSIRLFSTTTVGLSSRTAATIRPFTSYGEEGSATFRPGTWASQASRLWLCWGPADRPAPPAVVSVSGTETSPPNMNFSLAAWLYSWSMATPMKSKNIRSQTGRRPRAAAPTPIPMKPISEIGVSMTRLSP